MLLYTGTVVAVPYLIHYTIDNAIARGDLGGWAPPSGLNLAGLLFLIIVLLNVVGNYMYLRLMDKISQRVLYRLRTDMFDHLQRLSVPFFDRNEVGRVMSRVQNDVNQLQEFLPVLILSLGDLLSLGGIIVVMLLMNWKLGLIAFVAIPALLLIMLRWQRLAKSAFIDIRRAIAIVNGRLQQNIAGVRVVQSLNREELNLEQFDEVNKNHLDANLRAARLAGFLMPTVELLTAISLVLVILVGGNMVLRGTLQVGALVAFALYIQRFFDPVRNLTQQYTQLQRSTTAGVRIFELLDVKPEIRDRPQAEELPPIRGEVRYEGVGFEYVRGIPVLQEINLHIKAGQTVALVGPTGAGKTTMVSLLARFYDVASGRITVDGHDLRDVRRSSLAQQMSMVLQEPFLFSATVADNIRYRCREATDEQVEAAARAVGAHDFIIHLEHGYQTVLQERGGNLSMGQRQLISFARALLVDPRILILDEATANVDTFTEVAIQRALRHLLAGRTAVVIAHRLSTVQNADLIVVMDKGRVVDTGTHAKLLERGGLYSRLYALNFEEPAKEPVPSAARGVSAGLRMGSLPR
jgi:ATP-binding cassette subfamily B protein